MKLAGLLTVFLALLIYPETALNAAREAMQAWYTSVAPALFPFMALMPMLTCPASLRTWERMAGRWMRPVFGLPGSAAPAVFISMIAGSPAGAAAAAQVCANQGELERIVCCCGLSPAFLVTGIGAAMLNDVRFGYTLLIAQLLSQLTLLLLTRCAPAGESLRNDFRPPQTDPIRAAVLSILGVCGYMMLFSVLAALLRRIFRNETVGLALLCLLDAPSGTRAVAVSSIIIERKRLILAAVAGFGGLCIALQNLSACGGRVKLWRYLSAKACSAALTAAFSALLTDRRMISEGKVVPAMEISTLAAVILIVPTLFSWEKPHFLTKEILKKQPQFRRKTAENHNIRYKIRTLAYNIL
ncbi:MAG: hypothetical protein IJO98_05580 [Clostridia bacterium]|nr:hypothetical protein [Clostridia bacterium]